MERKRYTQADLEKRLEAMIAERGGRDAPLVSSTIHAEVRELQKRNKEQSEKVGDKLRHDGSAIGKKTEEKKALPKKPITKKPEPKKEPPKKKEEPKKEPLKKDAPKVTKGAGDTGKPAKQGGMTTLGDMLGIPYDVRRTKQTAEAVNRSTRRDKKIR